MDDTTNGHRGSPAPEPTPEGRARLLAALDLERARHPVEPGQLGEYVELLDRDGLAAARAAFPPVAAHLAAGCDACNAEVRELREIAALETSGPADAEPNRADPAPHLHTDIGRIVAAPPTGPTIATATIASDAAHADPVMDPVLRRRQRRTLMIGLTAVAAVAMVVMGASLYALASLGPRGGTGEIKLIARETVTPLPVAATPASTAAATTTSAAPLASAAPPTPAAPAPTVPAPTIVTAPAATPGPAATSAPPAAAPPPSPTPAPAASPGGPGAGSQPGTGSQPKPGAGGPAPPGSAAPSGNDCPDSHPVKANRESGIYHLRGGAFYDRTRPEVCFAAPDDAERAGFRRSQR